MTLRKILTRSQNDNRLQRAGFSLLELLVVMGVMALLLSLLMPALMQSRAGARKIVCQNHLRQLALAMLMHHDQQERFPAAGLFGTTGAKMYHNWVTAILPQLDQAVLYQQYDLSREYLDADNFSLTRTPVPVLTCPDDVSLERGEGNLSYVVNGGIGWTIPLDCPASVHVEDDQIIISPLDLNGNGTVCPLEQEPGPGPADLELLRALSLFFVENWPAKTGTQRFHRLRDVTDGTTTTLMLAENVRAGFDPRQQTSWGSPEPLRTMFFVSSEVCPDRACRKEQVDLARANGKGDSRTARESLNASLSQAEGTAPWPSSGHPGLVHVAWCDGRVSSLSEFIDGSVYFAAVTPQGGPATGLFAEPLITSSNF